jgi:hypothetical protein
MTASVGREVDANLLRGAAPGSAQARSDPQDAGSEYLGDLVEPLGRGHEVGVEGVRHRSKGLTRASTIIIVRVDGSRNNRSALVSEG